MRDPYSSRHVSYRSSAPSNATENSRIAISATRTAAWRRDQLRDRDRGTRRFPASAPQCAEQLEGSAIATRSPSATGAGSRFRISFATASLANRNRDRGWNGFYVPYNCIGTLVEPNFSRVSQENLVAAPLHPPSPAWGRPAPSGSGEVEHESREVRRAFAIRWR